MKTKKEKSLKESKMMIQTKSTEELLEIYNQEEDSGFEDDKFQIVKETLLERGVNLHDKSESKALLDHLDVDFEDYSLIIKDELSKWAIGLIVIGIIQLTSSSIVLFSIFGIWLIILGIITFILRKRVMFKIIGISLTLSGLSIILVLGDYFFAGAYEVLLLMSLGAIQLFLGYIDIMRYKKYAPRIVEESIPDHNFKKPITNDNLTDEIQSLDYQIQEPISEDNLEKLNSLNSQLKSLFKASKAADELSSLLDNMIHSKDDALQVIQRYKMKYNRDIVESINNNTTSYQRKKILLARFIDYGIIGSDYPHNYMINIS